MRDRKFAREIEIGDVIVIYRDDEDGRYHLAHGIRTPTFWRRVPATVVDVAEVEGTATEDRFEDRRPEGRGQIYILGEPPSVRLRFMVADQRYTIEQVSGRALFEVLSKHHPVCIECAEPWPCSEQRQDAEAIRFTHALDDLCHHCGKAIGGAHSTTFHDGLMRRRYHAAQKYRGPDRRRCKDAADEAYAAVLASRQPDLSGSHVTGEDQ